MIRFRWFVVALAAVGLGAGCSSMADRPFFARFRSYPVEGACCAGPGMEGAPVGDCGPPVPPAPSLVPAPPLADQPPLDPPPSPMPLAPGAPVPRLTPVPQAQPIPAQPTSRIIR
jgi:hypothetical protein